jgi:hypothetical protein
MNDLFTVVDQAAKTRYEGQSLRDGYDIWLQLAIVHVAYMTDEDDMPITDMDCGGGATLFWDDEYGEHMELFDSSCGRTMSCTDCMEDEDFFLMAENDGVQTPAQPQPLDEADEWVVFGHVNDTRLGYFADWRDAHVEYDAQHDKCRATTGHEQGLCHIRIAHKSDPKFLVQTGE